MWRVIVLSIGTAAAIAVVAMYAFKQPHASLDVIVVPLAINFVAAYVFYLLIIYFPRRKHLSLVRENFRRSSQHHKSCIISILLQAAHDFAGTGSVDDLRDVRRFREHFKKPYCPGQTRWHRVMNVLEENKALYRSLLFHLESLREVALYAMNNVQIDDPDVFVFFNVISERISILKHGEHYGEEVKSLTGFLWELFAGWSWIRGYTNEDYFDLMLRRLDESIN